MPKCDFCSEPNISWAYPCENFRQDIVVSTASVDWDSIGHWVACDKCAEIIEMGNTEALAKRSLETLRPMFSAVMLAHQDKILDRLYSLHLEFMVRRGTRVPADEYEGE